MQGKALLVRELLGERAEDAQAGPDHALDRLAAVGGERDQARPAVLLGLAARDEIISFFRSRLVAPPA